MEMANNNKLESTEEVNYKMRSSFSWDRAFFTSDGFLAAEELSSMIEGGGDDVNHELQKFEELESMEAKLFQEFEASTQKSTSINLSSGKRDSQAKKVTGERAPIKTPPKRSSPVSGGSPGNNVKPLARRSPSSKTGKANADSPSKTPPRITTKNKEASINTRISRTSPASPVSPGSSGSSSSTSAVSQRSKRSGSVPCRSTVNNEKPSATNAKRTDDWKSSKPAVSLMPKTHSSISLKNKPTPVISHPSSPSRQPGSSSSSSTCTVDQKSKSRGIKGSTVHHTSRPTLKNHHIGQTSDPKGNQPALTCKTGSTDGSKTVAGLKPNPRKTTTPKKQSRGTENILVISPELLDLQGKINALKMEISMHKKGRCNKMAHAEGNLKTPFAIEEFSL
ncbi:hypothetical protein L1987_36265 [Smallanthus sonchifolius]|uniref:Uncharacterized protein n=1 Tax=Smallanthus sonchifolius TaxID=185202 RepID=A0ACB9HEF7_9ASTR|nr:hypothetical protein L1987_36265 [Smallanthus sonchifolius]